ncbi:MAG: MFS transporter [Lysobacteraceae bacterium]|nr:MAG: MFS transporter [Xanthomonadaceae bacterium]
MPNVISSRIRGVTSPAWQAILPALVPRSDLPPAIALHAVGMNIARAIGPAVGGVLIVGLGIAWPFFVNAASFVAILAALWWWKAPASVHQTKQVSFGRSLLEGLAQAHGNAALRNTLLRSVLFYAFGAAYWALLPLVARELLGGTARLYGVLVGCIGVGAVLCALVLPRMRARLGLDGTVVAGTVGTALAMLVWGTVHDPVLGAVAGLIAGGAWIAALSSLNVAAQLAVPDTMRARGMALYTAVFYGCLAIGSLTWGHVATAIGVDVALRVAAVGAVLALAVARWVPVQR